MTNALRLAAVAAIGVIVSLAAGGVDARAHHHHHNAAAATPAVVCGRHHPHCHAVASHYSRRSAELAAAPERTGDNGVCKSVRLHGEWVQQCNFSNQGQ